MTDPQTYQPGPWSPPARPPRRHRRGAAWWLTVGWWWAPACWAGRVTLWLFAWPLGLWRSIRHGQRKQARR